VYLLPRWKSALALLLPSSSRRPCGFSRCVTPACLSKFLAALALEHFPPRTNHFSRRKREKFAAISVFLPHLFRFLEEDSSAGETPTKSLYVRGRRFSFQSVPMMHLEVIKRTVRQSGSWKLEDFFPNRETNRLFLILFINFPQIARRLLRARVVLLPLPRSRHRNLRRRTLERVLRSIRHGLRRRRRRRQRGQRAIPARRGALRPSRPRG